MSLSNNWSEEETTLALYEYCRKPFGQFNATKQFVIDLGHLIGRSPAAIVRKIGNLASFDPVMKARGVGGLPHTAKMDQIIWNKYYGHWDQLAYDAQIIISKLKHKSFEQSVEEEIDIKYLPQGKERVQAVKRRINQDFFRKAVLSSYENCCCISGICNSKLVEASHIVDWSIDENNRTNPQNGLCLNPFFHKAYDDNLIGISPDFEIIISDRLFDSELRISNKLNSLESFEVTKKYIMSFHHQRIIMPRRFLPDRNFLAEHYEGFIISNR